MNNRLLLKEVRPNVLAMVHWYAKQCTICWDTSVAEIIRAWFAEHTEYQGLISRGINRPICQCSRRNPLFLAKDDPCMCCNMLKCQAVKEKSHDKIS